jgi:hypothetical protein
MPRFTAAVIAAAAAIPAPATASFFARSDFMWIRFNAARKQPTYPDWRTSSTTDMKSEAE